MRRANRKSARALGVAGVVAMAVGGVSAQDAPLAGPALAGGEREASLVRVDYEGRVRRLEVPPEEAALELLELDAETLAAARRVVSERAAVMDRIVLENLELFPQFAAAEQAGDRLGQVRLFLEFVRVTEPLRRRGSLGEELRAVLPERARARFDALVSDYWRAAAGERVARAKAEGATVRAGDAMRQERFDAFGRELERSYARLSASESFFVEYLLRGLGLSEHQEKRVRAIIGEYDARAMRGATEAEKAEAFIGVIALLNERQREAFLERLRGF
ncbi:MAG: hypothetical protein KJZ54_00695 [Phycisphaerales bacterium]|nr:hypothetical protein [Phycisphaerales bacterium]